MNVTEEHMRQSADVTTDNTSSPEDASAALARDVYYYTSKPLRFPEGQAILDTRGTYYFDQAEGKWVCDCSEATPQDDFIRKCRGLLLAFVGCAVILAVVFIVIGGV